MTPVVFLLLSCVAGFLTGGIPFGYLVGRVVLDDDIRNHGSGNIGATNVGRVVGWSWGGIVLCLDALKGLVPTLGASYAATRVIPEQWQLHAGVAAGISAVVGHIYPVYLRLQGGKGVATALGVVIVLAPKAMSIALVVFIVVLTTSRRMALASILAAITFGLSYFLLVGRNAWTVPLASLTAFAFCIPSLIVWRHRSNIVRLLAGTEPAFTSKPKPTDGAADLREQTDRNKF